MIDYTPIDSYAPALQARAAREGRTAEQTFAERYAEERSREFADLRAASAAILAAPRELPRARSLAQFAAPDPYALALAKRRQAEATPESRFAEQYKAERLRELEEEYAAAAQRTARQPAARLMTAEELKQFEPPNGYQIALDKMKEDR